MKKMKYSSKVLLYKRTDDSIPYHPIYIRVRAKNKSVDLYTNFSTTLDKWDDEQKRVKPNAKIKGIRAKEINDAIATTQRFVEEFFDDCDFREVTPTLEELKVKYQRISKQEAEKIEGFFDIYAQYIEESNIQRQWSKSTYEMELRTRSKLMGVLPKLTFATLTTSNLNKFTTTLSATIANGKLKDYIKKLKAFGKWAKKNHYPVCEDLENYTMCKYHDVIKEVRFLEIEEVRCLWELDLSGNRRLEETRDFFVFQCFTSLRYSDLKALKRSAISQKGTDYTLSLFTQKNRKKVEDYLLPDIAVEIYKKYSKNNYENGVLFPVPANSQYNEYLKELGAIANFKGEWRDMSFQGNERIEKIIPRTHLTTHVARKTFVSYALNMGISQEIVALATSHSDVKEMIPYLGITKEGKEQMRDKFNEITK